MPGCRTSSARGTKGRAGHGHAMPRDEPPVEDDAAQERPASFLSRIGPGLITGAADDDPSGIATYSQAVANAGSPRDGACASPIRRWAASSWSAHASVGVVS